MMAPESKAEMRKRLKQLRSHLSPHQVEGLSRRITERLIETVDWSKIQRLHCYLPIKRLREVDTNELLQYLWSRHPEIQTYTSQILPQSTTMAAVPIGPNSAIVQNDYGIPEPQGETQADELNFDLIIIPVVGFDAACNRLGYGLGYYDRWLANHPGGQRIGLAYEVSRVDQIPVKEHDQTLSAIVTEQKFYRA
jgi:5-formyltetrahydrofolate cyclo-ligase